MRIVGVLAFCHALFFLALFLFICARAGAAVSKSTPALQLNLSTYSAQAQRDPFGSEASKSGKADISATVSAGADSFKLMGILYSPTNPSALINNELVELNKPVRVQIGQGEVEVKALAITRDTVVLEAGGHKMELRLGGDERAKESK
jgi:Tfp pilus assembly protein PilP